MTLRRSTIQYHPGTKTPYDPEHMLLTTSTDEIELMLEHTVALARTEDGQLTAWEREFVLSVNTEYERKVANGYTEYSLSGKQVVWLGHLYRKLAQRVAVALEQKA